jgi:hypothetical protein
LAGRFALGCGSVLFILLLGVVGISIALRSMPLSSPDGGLPRGSQVRAIPGATGSVPDLAVDDAGNLHLIWGASLKPEPRQALYYQRSEDDGKSWTRPESIAPWRDGHIFAGKSSVHVLGEANQHLLSTDGGHKWRTLDPLVGNWSRGNGLCLGDTLLYTWVDVDTREQRISLECVRVVQDREISRAKLGQLLLGREPAFFRSNLCSYDSRIHLVTGLTNWTAERIDPVAETVEPLPMSTLAHSWSQDGGATWSSLDEIPLGGHADRRFDGLSAVATRDGSFAYFASNYVSVPRDSVAARPEPGIYSIAWTRGRWGEPTWVSHRNNSGGAYASIEVIDARDRLVMGWIDGRHNWGMWNWRGFLMNPRDAMNWHPYMNNDVYLRLSERGQPFSTTDRLIRLTNEPSLAEGTVRMCSVGDRLLVVWAGRSRAGKGPDAFGAKPQIFMASIPVESRKSE